MHAALTLRYRSAMACKFKTRRESNGPVFCLSNELFESDLETYADDIKL